MIKPRSIAGRLTCGVTAAALVALVASGWLIYRGTERSTFHQIDTNLLAHAELMARQVEHERGEIVLEHGDRFETEKGGLDHGAFRIWTTAGEPIAHYPRLEDSEFPRFGSEHIEFRDLHLPDGRRMRAVSIRALPTYKAREGVAAPESLGTEVQVAVAHDISSEVASLASLTRLLAVIGLATFFVLAAAIQVFTRRALRPISHVRHELASRDGANLASEIRMKDSLPSELVPLAESFNSLLGRIREVSERERQFTSNAAHELRTPLAALTAILDQATRRERTHEESRDAFRRSLAMAHDMNQLVDRLLALARFDGTDVEMEVSSVPLEILIEGAVETYRKAAEARDLSVACDIPDGTQASTDPALLQVVINNLLDNAVCYANAGSQIRIVAVGGPDMVHMTITNEAEIDDPASIDRIFKPFWRADEARGRTGSHVGLGLSICHKIVELIGGTIRAEVPASGGLSITIVLPTAA